MIRKIFAAAMIILLIGPQASFAQGAAAKTDSSVFSGTIDSIAVPDPDRGSPEGSLIVVEGPGNVKKFTLNADTKFIDKNGKPIEGGDIELGDKITVKYSVGDEGSIAESLTLM